MVISHLLEILYKSYAYYNIINLFTPYLETIIQEHHNKSLISIKDKQYLIKFKYILQLCKKW